MPHPTPHTLLNRVRDRYEHLQRLEKELDHARQLLRNSVVAARNGGGSWQQIGKLTGTSTQAAWERYHDDPGLNDSMLERPAKAPARSWKAGDRVLAYHPRLHRDLGPAVVTLDFVDADRKRYVEVKFDDMPEAIRTAKTNVFESREPVPVA